MSESAPAAAAEPTAAPQPTPAPADPTNAGSPKTEAKQGVTAPAEPPKNPLSAQYAKIAQAEKQFRQQRSAFDAEKKAFQSEQNKLKAQLEELEKVRNEAKLNPTRALEYFNLGLPQLTDYIMNQEKPTPQSEIKVLKEELDNFKKQQHEERLRQQAQAAEAETKRVQTMYNNYKESLKKKITGNEKYEFVDLLGEDGIQNVVNTVEKTFTSSKKLLSDEEAIEQVNAATRSDIEKFLQDPRVKKLAQQIYGQPVDKQNGQAPKKTTGKTLTNNMSTEPVDVVPDFMMDDDERLKKAMSHLKFV